MKRDQVARVGLCCNSHRNGVFIGKLRAVNIEIGDHELSIATFGGSPFIEFVGETLIKIVGGKKSTAANRSFSYSPSSHVHWVGNWCWDEVTMERAEAMKMLRWLARRGWYTAESGTTGFFNWWDRQAEKGGDNDER